MRCRGNGAGSGPSSSLPILSLPSAMRVAVWGWICSCTTGLPRTPQAKQALGGFYATGSKGPAAVGPVSSPLRGGFMYCHHRGGPSMTKLDRSTTIRFLVCAMLVLAATSWAQTRPPIAEQIAKTYGLDSFGQIEAIRYTFNLQVPGANVSRSWVWQPKTDQVSYEGKDKDGKPVKVTYVRSQLNGEPANVQDDIDPAFINDQYNLLFPLHVYWDSGAEVQDMGRQKL